MSEECRVLTKEQYDEMFRRINELEQNLAGAEQSVQEGLEINEELKAENKELVKKCNLLNKKLKYAKNFIALVQRSNGNCRPEECEVTLRVLKEKK